MAQPTFEAVLNRWKGKPKHGAEVIMLQYLLQLGVDANEPGAYGQTVLQRLLQRWAATIRGVGPRPLSHDEVTVRPHSHHSCC